jgi:hypothetical protein
MTCRVFRSYQPHIEMERAFNCECSSTDPEGSYINNTSIASVPDLRPVHRPMCSVR